MRFLNKMFGNCSISPRMKYVIGVFCIGIYIAIIQYHMFFFVRFFMLEFVFA